MSSRNEKYTEDVLIKAALNSVSIAGVLRYLNIPSGMHTYIRRRMQILEVDTSHFTGQGSNRGESHTGGPSKLLPEQVLILGNSQQARVPARVLRRCLLEIGRVEVCEKCNIGSAWQGQMLRLHIDHIDGSSWNNTPENLRFLCPNCHSQTATFGSRNHRQAKLTA